ncbi:MAG: NAD-dependent epimerase/dehydratase family protein [Gammaproteobacteria bacterium]|jgi:nucleoside-diphosphate-sugar epimerase|nr:NAD-dependent epimerase/dehydratase family protein [Gammaproteobacteria bacterium]MDP6617358.1 NAD-dependent epimerase/dehydratase family protein [Gammaproteobacteria bacterium]MDP6694921.1 NAD-dependent epimerase/dehydratase family protein [Gammaproteobacteria bacterium]MDP7041349.1 NAD-dependent epimerase/dehydratase family protein [Gammaproteobacteria bacterium]
MKPTRILVTGATGFIGSRLCERLSLVHNLPYRALVRNFSRANRIARVDAEMVSGELLDKAALQEALSGCDVVMHLAHAEDRLAKKETRALVDACLQAGIQRFVHVSSMAVYGPEPGPECSSEETAVVGHYGEAYSDSKASQEAVVMAAVRNRNFPAVIVRPTVVYGPYSGFVPPVIEAAQHGHITLIDDGKGICNAVYVDDVCDAIVAAMQAESVIGGAFVINGDIPVSWHDFNLQLAMLVGKPFDVSNLASAEVREYWDSQAPGFTDNFRQLAGLLASNDFHTELARVPLFGSILGWTKNFLGEKLSDQQKLRIKLKLGQSSAPVRRSATSVEWPDPGRLVRECYPIVLSNQKAKNALGWAPAYSFEEGVQLTGQWLNFARMIDGRRDT